MVYEEYREKSSIKNVLGTGVIYLPSDPNELLLQLQVATTIAYLVNQEKKTEDKAIAEQKRQNLAIENNKGQGIFFKPYRGQGLYMKSY